MIRNLYTTSGLLIARGYDRVSVGGREPCVEFNHEQIVHDSIRRIHAAHYYFDEYRGLLTRQQVRERMDQLKAETKLSFQMIH